MEKKCVIFVCSGNTCRSPMAEYLLKAALQKINLADNFRVCSAGIMAVENARASDLAIRVMEDFNLDISGHVSQRATQELLDSADVIFCLAENHRTFLLSNYKKMSKKCFLVREFLNVKDKDIFDPFFGNIDDYRRVCNDISSAMDSIVKFLISNHEN
ncbi:MAG: low molecular weight protein arginine phosphatase [Puniceicoccales bacterium]|jgi:protein-tyrosine phosphatase|nr:low molecular weight protein arginine phosphatase [Puniceicoccales bacterium]